MWACLIELKSKVREKIKADIFAFKN